MTDPASGPAAPAAECEPQTALERRVLEGLRTLYDPEIPVNIVDLGLIYEVTEREDASVFIRMTLTAPGCPVADMIVQQVKRKAETTEGVAAAEVKLVFDPPWNKDLMTEVARFELGFEV